MLTATEENYLKALHRLSQSGDGITVKKIAASLSIKMPTVNSMVKNLAGKKLIRYEKYKAIELTDKGKKQALLILRKHRLTELFLKNVMGLGWEEVHDIAEQIEHLQSERFFNRIDDMLGHPDADPHGEPIPDANGKLPVYSTLSLCDGMVKKKYKLAGVTNHDPSFLKYLDSIGAGIGATIEIRQVQEFDKSMAVTVNGKMQTIFSYTVCRNLRVL